MRRRLTITLENSTLERADSYVDGITIRNRSHAIEHLLNAALNRTNIQAILLAGGNNAQRSMHPVDGTPLIGHIITRFTRQGIHEYIISGASEEVRSYCDDGNKWGVDITYTNEPIPLGTGGAIKKMREIITSSPCIIAYTDIYTTLDISDVLSFHARYGKDITMTVVGDSQKNLGHVTIRGSRVTGLYEGSDTETYLINAGIYIVNKSVFSDLPQGNFSFDDVVKKYIEQGKVGAYVYDGEWLSDELWEENRSNKPRKKIRQ